MKKLILLLLFIPLVAIGQNISVSNILKVAKMDRESFEIYAMDRGFVFHKVEEDEDIKGLVMFRGDIGSEEYLSNHSKYFGYKSYSCYQTYNTKRLSSIYKELKTLGFKLVDSKGLEKDSDGYQYVKNYKRGTKEMLDIYIKSDCVFIDYIRS
jgi:hypothetical protein